jgi:hypothetical protein
VANPELIESLKDYQGVCIMQFTRNIRSALAVTICALFSFSTPVFADLILAEGKPTGQWFNPERGGEGFFVEIISTGSTNQISIAMFTYDASGKQLWIMGNVGIGANDESVAVPVFVFDGPSWGDGYDVDDLNTTPFGTITARFPTCDSGLFSVNSDVALPSRDYSTVRLTDIEGVDCNDPPPEQSQPTGLWQGEGVCFNVSVDGTSITEVGSLCTADAAFDSNLSNGINNDGEECDVEADCEGVWEIEGGSFHCVSELGTLVVGQFESATRATGKSFEGEAGEGDYCVATWTASPDN